MPFNNDQSMWQLSFRLDSEDEAKQLLNGGGSDKGEFLKNEALKRCASWHEPVTQLIQVTVGRFPIYNLFHLS